MAKSNFTFTPTRLGGKLITPFFMQDNRGAFTKDFNTASLRNNDIFFVIQEVLNVTSKKGVLRGLHYQIENPQAKIVRCLHGSIFDVMVDVRKDSPTFGEWEGYYLTETNKTAFYIPRGFAHGYLALEDNSEVLYYCDNLHYPDDEWGIIYNDPKANIAWPFEAIGGEQNLNISEKDSCWRELGMTSTSRLIQGYF